MIEELEEKVPYNKKPLSIKTQVAKLETRGLVIDDENLAGNYLI
jgi:abortive infection bacteriophage resistance protein